MLIPETRIPNSISHPSKLKIMSVRFSQEWPLGDIEEDNKQEPFMSGAVILSITGAGDLSEHETEQIIKSFRKDPEHFDKDYEFNKDILKNVDMSYLIQSTEKYVPWLKRYLEGLIERAKQEPGLETAGINAVLVLQGSGINMVEYAKESEELKDRLWRIVYRSREDENITEASGIAISILNGCRISFSGMDLREIRIPRANMIGSICDSTDFSGADLRYVEFADSFFNNVKFNKAGLSQARFGVTSILKEKSEITCIELSMDGKQIVIGTGDKTIKIWDIQSGVCIQMLKGHSDSISSLSINKDGKRVASGSEDKTVKVWDIKSGQCVQTFNGHPYNVNRVSLSGDGKQLVSGSLNWQDCSTNVRMWDIEQGACIREFTIQATKCVSLSADRKQVITGNEDKTVKVWDIESGECVQTFTGNINREVNRVSLSSNANRVVSEIGCFPNKSIIQVWDLEHKECVRDFTIQHGSIYKFCVSLNQDGSLVTGGNKVGDVQIWDVASGECVKILAGHTKYVSFLRLSQNGERVISMGKERKAQIIRICDWNTESEKRIKIFSGHTDQVKIVRLSRDGKQLVSGSLDIGGNFTNIRVWDTEYGDCVQSFMIQTQYVNCISISKDGKKIASGSGNEWTAGNLKIWDTKTGECLKTLTGHTNAIVCVVISEDGTRAVSGSWDTSVRVWDIETGECVHTLLGHDHWISAVWLSKDEKFILSGSWDNSIRIWDIETGECIQTFVGHNDRVLSISMDQKLVVSGDNKNVCVWDIDSGKCIQKFMGHTDDVISVDIVRTVDGIRIVSAGEDGNVRIWDIETGNCIQTLTSHTDRVNCISLTADGKQLVTGSDDTTIRMWDISKLPEVRLIWIGHGFPCPLSAEGAEIQDVQGLSMLNRQVLRQLGAIWEEIDICMAAIKRGDITRIADIMHNGFDVNMKNDQDLTLLMCAAQNGKLAAAIYLVEEAKADINTKCKNDNQAIHMAAENHHINIVKFLLRHGADVEAMGSNNETPLLKAYKANKIGMVKYLVVEVNANIEAKDKNGNQLIHLAVENNDIDTIEFLLTYGADIEAIGSNGETPLLRTTKDHKIETVRYLVEKTEANINAKNKDGNHLIHLMLILGYKEIVEYLLSQGADANQPNDEGWTPLVIAARNGNEYEDMIQVFREGYENPQTADSEILIGEAIGKCDERKYESLRVHSSRLCLVK